MLREKLPFLVVHFTFTWDIFLFLENDTFLNLLEPLTNFDTRDLQIHPYTIYMNEFTDVTGLTGIGWLLLTMNEKGNKNKKSYIVT